MTMLVTSIVANRVDEMRALALEALERGSDAVELRLDGLQDSEASIAGIADELPSSRWIATCRSAAEGGMSRGGVESRLSRLLSAGQIGEGFIDFEFSDWERSALARDTVARRGAAAGSRGCPPSLILSHHDFVRRPADLESLVDRMCAVPEAVAIKLAWPAEDILSNFDAFRVMRTAGKDAVAICMGETGLMSRVLAKKFGAFASYCSPQADSSTASGQLTLSEMRERYRWDSINATTEVYGVIGCPVAHSMGPAIFNDAFAAGRVSGVYLPLHVEPGYDNLAAFLDACMEHDWLDARGFSVTLPHKVDALRYLGDRVDPPADRIGAVNTIRIDEGEIWGCNTDSGAAIDTLTAGMGCGAEDLEGVPVSVLGAGGVSRAVVAALVECGCAVTVFNRDAARARALADTFDCQARAWEERVGPGSKILINCTSVGMWPEVAVSPMPADALPADTVVFDTVYRPAETQLLRDARAAGCKAIDGMGMFLHQACQQYEYWTQQPADWDRMASVVTGVLASEE